MFSAGDYVMHARTSEGVLGSWKNHLVVVHQSGVSRDFARMIRLRAVSLARSSPGRGAYFALALPSAGLPDADARSEFIAMGRDLTDLAVMIAILEGDGFLNAARRAAISGIALAARVGFPVKIVSSVDEGAALVEGPLYAPLSLSRAEVTAALTHARQVTLSPPRSNRPVAG